MRDILDIREHKYFNTGMLEIEGRKILLAYDYEIGRLEFFKVLDLGFVNKQYVKIEDEELDMIFNSYDDMLYSKTFDSFDLSKLDDKTVESEKYKAIFNETLRLICHSIKELYKDISLDNFERRIASLKFEMVDNNNIYASFSRKDNIIYISKKTFRRPTLLVNVVAHELFHVIGTVTTLDNNGNIKNNTSKRSGFESSEGFMKGINEGFIQMQANVIYPESEIYSYETRCAEIISQILGLNLAYDNSIANIDTINTLTRNHDKFIRFIKILDNYHRITNISQIKLKTSKYMNDRIKYTFISDSEKLLIEFFFERLIDDIRDKRITRKDEIVEREKEFKNKLVFYENITNELKIDAANIIDEFDEVKDLFLDKLKKVDYAIENYLLKRKHSSSYNFVRNVKKICTYTYNVTDVLQIIDESFKKTFNLSDERVYLIAQKINNKRKFYIISRDSDDNILEILNDDVKIMKDLVDATVYNNLDISDEAREKERRYHLGRTFSIYRSIEGEFGIADLVDGQNKILRALKTIKIKLPHKLLDDSLEDFSYLESYIKPEIEM